MTEQELREAIDRTKAEIYEIRNQLKSSTDPKKQKHLKARLMELLVLAYIFVKILTVPLVKKWTLPKGGVFVFLA